jgi:hypothetical protein
VVAWSVLGAGLGVLASGVTAFFVFPATSASVAVVPGPAGGAVFVTAPF